MKKGGLITLLFCGISLSTGCSDNGILFRSVGSYQPQTNRSVYLIEKPYEINGITYTPTEDYNYFDSGDAFWFETDASHPLTANGERADSSRYTAMHRTLPLPSIVRITNLNNRASVLVRVNDRGPYDNNRLIDVSKSAAEYLNFSKTEVTPVQVEVMVAESKALKEELQKSQNTYTHTFENTPKNSSYQRGEVSVSADSILYPGMKEENIQKLKVSTKSPAQSTTQEKTYQPTIQKKPVQKTPVIESDNDIIYSGAAAYYIQIGAFSRQESVNNIRKKLKNYKNLFVSNKMKNGQLLHQVRVGPFSNVYEAQKTLDKIHGTGYPEAKIIHE